MSGDDDAWGFLSERRGRRLVPDDASPVPEAEARTEQPMASTSGRAHGVFRGSMEAVPLRRRALPMALALAAVSIAGLLTEMVAAAQMLTLVGPQALLVIFPVGGVGLLLIAVVQMRYIDHRARLPMLRVVSLGYAVAFAIALALVAGSVVPVIAIGLIWILADQLNFLVPLLIWSLAGDEFNVAEGRKVFGWIVTWTYAGQIIGLALATASPSILGAINLPLTSILVISPIVCLLVGILLPRAMRHAAAAKGLARDENLRESVASAADFVRGIPTWRAFFIGSLLTFAAGMTAYLGYASSAENLIPDDAGTLQAYLGGVALGAFAICWLLQVFVAERLQERIGIPGVLLILPIATVVAGVVLAVGIAVGSLPLLAAGVALWLIPRWSIDENARRGALSLVPDERRARVSFIVDLTPMAVGLIAAGPLALVGVLTDRLWITSIVAVVLAGTAIPFALKVRRTWEDSLLSWRLRRRKRNRTLDFGLEAPTVEESAVEPAGADAGAGEPHRTPWLLRIGMRWKLLIAFAGAFTIIYLVIAVWVFNYTSGSAYNRLTSQLAATATGGAQTINPEIFERLVTTVEPVPDPGNPMGLGYPDSALYRDVALDLYRIMQVVNEAQPYSYFRNPDDGQLYFAASSGYYTEPRIGVPFGVPVADVVPLLAYSLMEQGLTGLTEQGAYEDEYGSWISAYAPIADEEGRVVGAIGIDYPLSYVDAVEDEVRRNLALILGVTYVILLALVVGISGAVVRPLRRLTAASRRIADGEYELDLRPVVRTRFPDEMAELANSFAQMAAKVAARERSLAREVKRLRVEIDEVKREAAVKEITESDFFSDLTSKAADMRRRMREGDETSE